LAVLDGQAVNTHDVDYGGGNVDVFGEIFDYALADLAGQTLKCILPKTAVA
jgi:hypothetical protein